MNQESIKNSILDYLKEEGFAPKIDDDGDITFKKEGDRYYVFIDEKESSPFFLSISLLRTMEEGYDMDKALSVAFEIQRYKGIKVSLNKSSIETVAPMFFQNPKHFNDVFARTTQIMLWAMDDFCEKFFG